MRKLFWGFFLIFLDFKLSFGISTLHLLPNWLGYAILAAGCSQLEKESELFEKARIFCLALAGVNLFVWLGDLVGFTWGNHVPGIISQGMTPALFCLRLYVIRIIINAIAQTEVRRNYDLSAAHLRRIWVAITVSFAASLLFMWLPILSAIAAVAASIAGIIFLFAFHGTRKSYEQMLADYAQGF